MPYFLRPFSPFIMEAIVESDRCRHEFIYVDGLEAGDIHIKIFVP